MCFFIVMTTQFLANRKGHARLLHKDSQLCRKESADFRRFREVVLFDYMASGRSGMSHVKHCLTYWAVTTTIVSVASGLITPRKFC